MTRKPSHTADVGRPRRRSAYPWIVAAILLGGGGLLLATSFGGGQYAMSDFGAVLSDFEHFEGEKMRVVGHIKEGSTREAIVDGQPVLSFAVVDGQGNELDVHYAKSRPDPYKEGRECIIEGRLDEGRVLQASVLTVKCPSKYQSEDGLVDRSPEYYEEKYGSPPAGGGPSS